MPAPIGDAARTRDIAATVTSEAARPSSAGMLRGLRLMLGELQSWLLKDKVDILAIQECQFGKAPSRIAGFQPPVITGRTRGRTAAAGVKGGDVAVYLRAGLQFTPLTERRLAPARQRCTECVSSDRNPWIFLTLTGRLFDLEKPMNDATISTRTSSPPTTTPSLWGT